MTEPVMDIRRNSEENYRMFEFIFSDSLENVQRA